ncbi:MAG TPA: radical SAM family heme chaperone HemW [Gemmatimonadaceae bacterium]|nr:radical SAM family heme chaperone HemW [Gemmatimonadaceae bacterium]
MRPRHLYVHVPFCARRCAYCDFSIAVRARTPVDEYLRGLAAELALRFPPVEPWRLDTLYLGGGTPSRLGAEGIAGLLDLVRERATIAADAEVTVEANPEDVDERTVDAWMAAGVNRLSIGVQSFEDEVLRWMHRVHDAAAAERAVRAARSAGLQNLSIDLIFALPEALRRVWPDDLSRAIDLAPTHVSLYGLTVEPHTPLSRWRERGEVEESPEERYEAEYLLAHERLAAAGFDHYEVSNFGLPERHARHNGAYWTGAAYAGIGPAAHEFDGFSRRRWNVAPYAEWQRRLASGLDPEGGYERLDDENRTAEDVYLGLRTTGGLPLRSGEADRVSRWVDAGWARLLPEDRLVLTPTGWLRLDALARDLTSLRSR